MTSLMVCFLTVSSHRIKIKKMINFENVQNKNIEVCKNLSHFWEPYKTFRKKTTLPVPPVLTPSGCKNIGLRKLCE